MESKPEEIEREKYQQFRKDIKDENAFSEKLNNLYYTEFEEIFQDLLLFPEEEIISSLTTGVRMILSDSYTEDIFQNKSLNSLLDKAKNKIKLEYDTHYQILNKAWLHYKNKISKTPNHESFFLSNFRKHCPNTDDYAYHPCGKKTSKFLEVYVKRKLQYVICIECQKCFFIEMIQCYCTHCSVEYYSSTLSSNEDPMLLPATWEYYHCKQILNERMKCIKCRELLYINLKTRMLNCLNPKCKFIGKPSSIEWICVICKNDFKSNAIIYNPLERKVIKKIIQQTLLIKHKAHPSKVPCCKLNIFFTNFYHKKECDGILYVGELKRRVIIVCEKCKAINFYESFIWTCPKCFTRFKDKSSISEIQSSFEQKRVMISAREELHATRKAIEVFGSPRKRPKVQNLLEGLKERKRNIENNDIFQHIRAKSEMNDTSLINEEIFKVIKDTKIPNNKFLNVRKDNIIERSETEVEKEQDNKRNFKVEMKENKFRLRDEKKEENKDIKEKKPFRYSPKKEKEKPLITEPPKKEDKEDNRKKEEEDNKEQSDNKIYMSTMPNSENINSKELRKMERRINRILQNGKLEQFDIDDYNIMRQLGEGSYGIIFQVQEKETKKRYAIKKIIAHDLEEVVAFQKEFELVNSVDHPNIMKIYGICIKNLDITTIAIYVLMEMAQLDWDDEIRKHLDQRKNYKEEELINILKQLVSALCFMQRNKISHRDIKPQNVLVFKHGVYKVADFGEAKEVKISKQVNTLRGTELYMSPILYDGLKQNKEDIRHNSFKSDVFSLGFCFIYAASLNFNIIYEVRDIKDMKKMESILYRHLKNKYSKEFISLLLNLLEVDESKRFDFIELSSYIKENYPD